MKREIMSTERYEEVLDSLETDANAFDKLTKGEKQEIRRDGYAMTIAAATNINNLRFMSKALKQDKTFMCGLIKEVNPLAMTYCYKTWFQNKNFVEFVRESAREDAKKYNSARMEKLYNELIDQQIQKSNPMEIEK